MSSDPGEPESGVIEVHPDYKEERDSDMMLIASDGQAFRVHSIIMKLASGVFQTMIDVNHGSESPKEPIHVQEDSSIIKSLLDIIYPNKLSFGFSVPTFTHFRDVCHAAEKYEMQGALQALRVSLKHMYSWIHPLLAFALASRYGWTDELRVFSTATLRFNLHSPELMKDLQLIPSEWLLKLMGLHRRRRDLLVSSLTLSTRHSPDPTVKWSSVKATNSRCNNIQDHFETPCWELLQYRLSQEMERRPDGSSIREQIFWDRNEFDGIWEIRCNSCPQPIGERSVIMDKFKLKSEVIRVLDELPGTI